MVKKIMADGSPCAKCDEIEQRLRRDGWAARIERTVIADERDADSEGMQLARRHGVSLAPFFIVSGDGGEHVYTSYLKLVREIFAAGVCDWAQPGVGQTGLRDTWMKF